MVPDGHGVDLWVVSHSGRDVQKNDFNIQRFNSTSIVSNSLGRTYGPKTEGRHKCSDIEVKGYE